MVRVGTKFVRRAQAQMAECWVKRVVGGVWAFGSAVSGVRVCERSVCVVIEDDWNLAD